MVMASWFCFCQQPSARREDLWIFCQRWTVSLCCRHTVKLLWVGKSQSIAPGGGRGETILTHIFLLTPNANRTEPNRTEPTDLVPFNHLNREYNILSSYDFTSQTITCLYRCELLCLGKGFSVVRRSSHSSSTKWTHNALFSGMGHDFHHGSRLTLLHSVADGCEWLRHGGDTEPTTTTTRSRKDLSWNLIWCGFPRGAGEGEGLPKKRTIIMAN